MWTCRVGWKRYSSSPPTPLIFLGPRFALLRGSLRPGAFSTSSQPDSFSDRVSRVAFLVSGSAPSPRCAPSRRFHVKNIKKATSLEELTPAFPDGRPPPPPRRIRKTLDCSLRVRPFFLFFNMRRSRNVKVSWGAPARTHPRPTKYELKANPEPMRCRTPRANLIFPDTFSPLKNPE